jgi:hypothetical protein
LRQFLYLAVIAEASESLLRFSVGALDAFPEEVAKFREEVRRVLNCGSALFEAAQRSGNFNLVVATDLPSALAGVALRDASGAALAIDARVRWPEPELGARNWHIEFWTNFARHLVTQADVAIAASPQPAARMAEDYGREFVVVPDYSSSEAADNALCQWLRAADHAQTSSAAREAWDLSWVDDPRAMRSRAPAEAETSRLLKAYAGDITRLYGDDPRQAELETARLLHTYAAEIVRLNEYFPAEIARLHEVYPAEIAVLNTEITRLHDVYKAEIARLNTEIQRLQQIIEGNWGVRLYRLCQRGRSRIRQTLQNTGAIRS